jgi:excinuclease ABC subunit C
VSQEPASPDGLSPELRDSLERLPREPGVYLFRDRAGAVLYVGKAKSLHARVRSYFARAQGDERAFVPLLERLLGAIETIVTASEKEALLLENTLIKQHRPRFNVMLRDDKSFLVLRLDPRASFPRLEVTRASKVQEDGARYFGPYHSASDCRQTLRVVNRHFQLRTCSDRALASRKRPCLQHQIGRCLAPCVLEVDPARYAEQVEDVTLFLRGRRDELRGELERRMRAAAAELEFERAARLRDQIAALASSLERQGVVSTELGEDLDAIGLAREGDRVELAVLLFRRGKLVGRRSFALAEQELPDDEVLSSFLARYYDAERGEEVPARVLLPLLVEDAALKAEWLSERRAAPVELLAPQRGERRRLLELARRNAAAGLASRQRGVEDAVEALAKLQRRLRLSRPPRRIECYDISTLQGRQTVAAMTVMLDAALAPASYRRFRIKGAATDDFAAIYEVLSRRLRRARGDDPAWAAPDLIVVDGGKAQLAMVLAALSDLGVREWLEAGIDVVALAKERDDAERPDRVFLPHVKDPIRLRPNTAELHLLARLRDEAHRFAITYHRRLRRKQALRSSLEEIPGIGPGRRRQLLRALGSLRRIRQASVEELAAVPGMTLRAAEAVAGYFAGPPAARPEAGPPAARPAREEEP